MENDVLNGSSRKKRKRGTRGHGREISKPSAAKKRPPKFSDGGSFPDVSNISIESVSGDGMKFFPRKTEIERKWDPVMVDKRAISWRTIFFKHNKNKSNLVPFINRGPRTQAVKFITENILDAKSKKFIGVKLEILLAEAGIRVKRDLDEFGKGFTKNLLMGRLKGIRRKCSLNINPTDVESQAVPKTCVNLFLRQIYIRYFPKKLLEPENQRCLFRVFPKLLDKTYTSELDLYFFTYYMQPDKVTWLSGLLPEEKKETFGRLGKR